MHAFPCLQCADVALHQRAVDRGGCWEEGERPECVLTMSGGSTASLHHRATAIPGTHEQLPVISRWAS